MRFTLFSIDSDDLSVTISMRENCQKSGAKCSSGGNVEKNNESALKDWKWPLKHESQQKSFGGRKSELQAMTTETWESIKELWGQKKWTTSSRQQFIIQKIIISIIGPWPPSFSLIIYQRNYIRSYNIRNTNLEASNGWWSTLILTLQAVIITQLHRRPVRIMHIIHNMHTLAFIYCEILTLYGKKFWLYKYSVTKIQN